MGKVTFLVYDNGDSSVGIPGSQLRVSMDWEPLIQMHSDDHAKLVREVKKQLKQAFMEWFDFKTHVCVESYEDDDFKPWKCPNREEHEELADDKSRVAHACHCDNCGKTGVLLDEKHNECAACFHKNKWPQGCPAMCSGCADRLQAEYEQAEERRRDRY